MTTKTKFKKAIKKLLWIFRYWFFIKYHRTERDFYAQKGLSISIREMHLFKINANAIRRIYLYRYDVLRLKKN